MQAAAACSAWRLGRLGERGAAGAGEVGQPPVGARSWGERSPEKAGQAGRGRGLRGQRAGLGGRRVLGTRPGAGGVWGLWRRLV